MCRDTKLMVSWRVGDRSADTAYEFMEDLQGRLANRVQLTSDGNMAYVDAGAASFSGQIDYAMLVKVFGPGRGASARKRYMGTHVIHVFGRPDPASISTSFVERSNLTMRMNMRRFTRKTNGFSKKVENHTAAVELHMLNYNFLRTDETLRVDAGHGGRDRGPLHGGVRPGGDDRGGLRGAAAEDAGPYRKRS